MKMNKTTWIIIAVVAVVVLALVLVLCLPKNGGETPGGENPPAETEYLLSIAVDSAFDSDDQEQSNVACAIVFDKDGKIVKAAFDSFATKFGYNSGALVTVERITTKYELGESYGGTAVPEYLQMGSGSWQKQADAFVTAIIGKTAAEVKAMGATVAGCTMPNTTPIFVALVEEAYNYERKVSFKTADDIKLGFTIEASLDGTAESASVASDYAAVVFADGKSVAAMLDSAENIYTLTIAGEGENKSFVAAPSTKYDEIYKGTKNEQGDDYNMVAWGGACAEWYAQAQYYADTTVGKTAAGIAELSTDKVIGSCTITVDSYKVALIAATAKIK